MTPHNHAAAESGAKERRDGVLIATNHDLYNSDADLQITRRWREGGSTRIEEIETVSVLRAAREATDTEFVALFGQEFSTIKVSDHVAVLDYDDVLTTTNGDFQGLYDLFDRRLEAGIRAPIVQLNHPNVQADLFYRGNNEKTRRKMRNDYGIDIGDLGPHFKDLVAASDRYVTLIEMLSGPAMAKRMLAAIATAHIRTTITSTS